MRHGVGLHTYVCMYIHWSYAPACMQSSITSTYSGYTTITCRPSRNDSDAPRAGKEGREPMACLSSPSKKPGSDDVQQLELSWTVDGIRILLNSIINIWGISQQLQATMTETTSSLVYPTTSIRASAAQSRATRTQRLGRRLQAHKEHYQTLARER
jgi:hypothetical protein